MAAEGGGSEVDVVTSAMGSEATAAGVTDASSGGVGWMRASAGEEETAADDGTGEFFAFCCAMCSALILFRARRFANAISWFNFISAQRALLSGVSKIGLRTDNDCEGEEEEATVASCCACCSFNFRSAIARAISNCNLTSANIADCSCAGEREEAEGAAIGGARGGCDGTNEAEAEAEVAEEEKADEDDAMDTSTVAGGDVEMN